MKPEARRFIRQAHACIGRAETMLTVELNEDAARMAYLACFQVAQAYIFEKTDKTSKSHHGVQTEFFRLTKDLAEIDPVLRRFLSQSYEYKSAADYFTGDHAATSSQEANEALATAKRFVAHVIALLGDTD